MIYSVYGYYGKVNSRKAQSKIEAIVFASNRDKAEQLILGLFEDYPAYVEYLNIVGGIEKDITRIYKQRPELVGIDPEQGYIYNKMYHIQCIDKYFR